MAATPTTAPTIAPMGARGPGTGTGVEVPVVSVGIGLVVGEVVVLGRVAAMEAYGKDSFAPG